MRAVAAPNALGLIEAVKGDLRNGDVVMVKGSNASKVSEVARALETGEAPAQKASGA
jgi:UDP-N-acetylmuramyl pentapeptide synthase